MSGDLKYWLDGLPVVNTVAASDGSFKYWLDGLPVMFTIAGGAPPAVMKQSAAGGLFAVDAGSTSAEHFGSAG
jgi:hypothetical protein